MTSPLYSQKASIDTCCVPCNTLRKALIIKEERTYCGKQLGFARDSIAVLEQVIQHKDTIISFKDNYYDNGALKNKFFSFEKLTKD